MNQQLFEDIYLWVAQSSIDGACVREFPGIFMEYTGKLSAIRMRDLLIYTEDRLIPDHPEMYGKLQALVRSLEAAEKIV